MYKNYGVEREKKKRQGYRCQIEGPLITRVVQGLKCGHVNSNAAIKAGVWPQDALHVLFEECRRSHTRTSEQHTPSML
jgi:hypothetical protein